MWDGDLGWGIESWLFYFVFVFVGREEVPCVVQRLAACDILSDEGFNAGIVLWPGGRAGNSWSPGPLAWDRARRDKTMPCRLVLGLGLVLSFMPVLTGECLAPGRRLGFV